MDTVKRVLLADYDEPFREELRRAIESTGAFEIVAETGDGAEAFALLKQLQPDIMLLNLQLPYMDGMEILSRAGQAAPRTMCVVITAFQNDNAINEAAGYGARDYLIKPCRTERVVERLLQLAQPCSNGVVRRIERTMQNLCAPIHVEGYRCFVTAESVLKDDPEAIRCVTKRLYPEIAKRRGSTGYAVERAMRECIRMAWERGMQEQLERRYGRRLQVHPTVREFLTLVMELERETESRCRHVG